MTATCDVGDEGRAYTEPVVPTLADMDDADIDMSECASTILEGLCGDAFFFAKELGPDIRLSEAMRATLLVELSRQRPAHTHTHSRGICQVIVQHHSVVHMKDRLLTECTGV